MRIISQVLSLAGLALSGLLFLRPRSPTQNLTLGILKILATTMSP
jgi:hypothetical protein